MKQEYPVYTIDDDTTLQDLSGPVLSLMASDVHIQFHKKVWQLTQITFPKILAILLIITCTQCADIDEHRLCRFFLREIKSTKL